MLRLFLLWYVFALIAAFLLLRGQIFDTRSSRDPAAPGTHKIHEEAVPRIGGISIFLGWLAGLVAARYAGHLDWFTTHCGLVVERDLAACYLRSVLRPGVPGRLSTGGDAGGGK